jgi:enterochelin esterase-like enzyme
MKKHFILKIALLALLLGSSLNLAAQVSRGRVVEGLTLESEIMNEEVRYTVYLPYDYESSNRHYPVVYLLHGYTDNDMGWIQFGEAHMKADRAIATGEIPPMILVMPDAGVSWYMNNYDGSVPYEDFFFQEFIPHIEEKYRIRKEKRYRGIAGLSMGGYGALLYSLKHHHMFSACAAFSAAIYTREQIKTFSKKRWENTESLLYGPNLEGGERITQHFLDNNPFHLVREGDRAQIKSVRYYLDCGDDDKLSVANNKFHNLLVKHQIPHEYRVRDGSHSWPYWRSGLVDGLKFIGKSFHQF